MSQSGSRPTFNRSARVREVHARDRDQLRLELIAEEMTSPQIAKKLFISLSTVENHRLNLLFKLGVKNAVGLVRKAIQFGLIR